MKKEKDMKQISILKAAPSQAMTPGKTAALCKATALAALLLTAAACSSELPNTDLPLPQPGTDGPQITVTATWPDASQTGADTGANTGADATPDTPQTRLAYDFTPADGSVNVNWKDGDKFYVGSDWSVAIDYGAVLSDAQSGFKPFTLTGGKDTKSGTFTGSLPDGATDGTQLYAVYGDGDVVKRGIYNDKETFLLSYFEQRQTTNGSHDHLAGYDLMWATAAYQSSTSTAFNFKHAGAMMKFTLTLPQSGLTVRELRLTTDDAKYASFCMQQRLTKDKDAKTMTSASNGNYNYALIKLGADINSGLAVSGKELTVYMMMAPTLNEANYPLNGKKITLIVTGTDDRFYSATLTGSPIEEGKYYTVAATLASTFNGGNGTESDPYQINDAGQLRNLAMIVNSGMQYLDAPWGTEGSYSNRYYKLTAASIDLNNEEWTPIGISTNNNRFLGNFSGAYQAGSSCEITNMSITQDNTAGTAYYGLFGEVEGGTISDVTVAGKIEFTPNASSRYHHKDIGGIAGLFTDGSLENCTSRCGITISGNATPQINVGGILGYCFKSTNLTNCTNSGTVSATANAAYAGGIIGYFPKATGSMTECTNTALITAAGDETAHYAGSLIGFAKQDDSNKATFTINGYTSSGNANEVLIGQYKFPNPNDNGNSILVKKTTDDPGTTLNSGTGSYSPAPPAGGETGGI